MKKYIGGVYIEEEALIRESGEIEIKGRSLIFSNENRQVTLSIPKIKTRFGGTAKRIVYLSDPAHTNITIHTTDFSILKHKEFSYHESAEDVKKQKNKHNRTLIATFIALAFLVLVPSYLIFVERTIVSGVIAEKVPISVEQALGDHLFNLQFAKSSKMITDPEIISELNTLAQPLLSTVEHTGFDFRIHIMEDKSANALALPGGNIVVFTGLIEQSERAEELLGVLAHEMAHVVERHSLKQMISEMSGYILFNIITAGAGDLVYVIGDNARGFLSKDYSRTQEQDADEKGFEYLVQAEISPDGLIQFFEKLDQEENIMDSEILSFASTHPSSKNRVKNLNNMLKDNNRAFDSVDFSYQNFKNKLSAITDPNAVLELDSNNMETTDETKN